jgi:hypothetical protein
MECSLSLVTSIPLLFVTRLIFATLVVEIWLAAGRSQFRHHNQEHDHAENLERQAEDEDRAR